MLNFMKALSTAVYVAAGLFLCSLPSYAASVTKADVEREANAGHFDQAYELLVKLAESGHAQAQGFLAYVLYEGEWGVPVDEPQAKQWMLKALDQDDAYAHLYVGLTNFPDGQEGFENKIYSPLTKDWRANIQKSAEEGHPHGQFVWGNMLVYRHKYKQAIEWYRKAAGQGHEFAAVEEQLTLGWYTYPLRIRTEELTELNSVGNPRGYSTLASAYTFGLQALVDYEVAYKYLMLGIFLGDKAEERTRKKIIEKVPESKRAPIAEQAGEMLQVWVDDPSTFLGLSAQWCVDSDNYDLQCVKQGVEHHQLCVVPYALWNMESHISFPGYVKCRATLYKQ